MKRTKPPAILRKSHERLLKTALWKAYPSHYGRYWTAHVTYPELLALVNAGVLHDQAPWVLDYYRERIKRGEGGSTYFNFQPGKLDMDGKHRNR